MSNTATLWSNNSPYFFMNMPEGQKGVWRDTPDPSSSFRNKQSPKMHDRTQSVKEFTLEPKITRLNPKGERLVKPAKLRNELERKFEGFRTKQGRKAAFEFLYSVPGEHREQAHLYMLEMYHELSMEVFTMQKAVDRVAMESMALIWRADLFVKWRAQSGIDRKKNTFTQYVETALEEVGLGKDVKDIVLKYTRNDLLKDLEYESYDDADPEYGIEPRPIKLRVNYKRQAESLETSRLAYLKKSEELQELLQYMKTQIEKIAVADGSS